MAITASRTRNQTTLNNLAKMLAGLNGEYGFCLQLLEAGNLESADVERLQKHVSVLAAKREALRLTLLQFNPQLDVESIRGLDTWRVRLSKRKISPTNLGKRLITELRQPPT